MKIHWHRKLGRSKNWFLGGVLGGVPKGGGGWHPQTMSKCLSVKYVLISQKTGTLVEANQKINLLGGPFWGGPGG